MAPRYTFPLMPPAILAVTLALALANAPAASAQKTPETSDRDRAIEIMATDPAEARRLLEPLAKAGDAEAMNALAGLIQWDGPEVDAFQGATRLLHLQVLAHRWRPGALPLRWRDGAPAPQLADTGSWPTSTV